MAASGWMDTSNQYIKYWIEAIQNSQDIANNTSNVTVRVWIQRTNTGYTTYGNGTVYCAIDGTTYTAAITTAHKITNTPLKIFERTVTINHNSDGTKTLGMAAYFSHSAFSSNSQSWSMGLTTIPRSSAPSLDSHYAWLGNATITINTNRKSGSFTHTIRYSFKNASGTIAYGVTDRTTWSPSIELARQIPNDSFATGYIHCDTYNGGTFIGTQSTWVELHVYGGPDFTTITHSENNATIKSKIGSYVQGLSRLNLEITGAQGYYGSSITAYEISFNGAVYRSNKATSGEISGSGTLTITGKVTDSRGKTVTKSVTISVLAYSPPRITSFSVFRSGATGLPDDLGTYARVIRAGTWTTLNGKNALTITIKSKQRGSANWETVNSISAGTGGSYNGGITLGTYVVLNSYDFMVEFRDEFNTTISLEVLPTGDVTMSWSKKGVGIGKAWEKGALDVRGDVHVEGTLHVNNKKLIDLVYPVGAVYISVNATNPGTLFGGTWVPFAQGRTLVGIDTADTSFNTVEKTGGTKTHKLTVEEMPSHEHTISWMNSVYSAGINAWYTDASLREAYGTGTQRTLWGNGIFANSRGSDQPHNNLQPYITTYMWKRTA